MNVKKPDPQDFGITLDEYQQYAWRHRDQLDALGTVLAIVGGSLTVIFMFLSFVAFFYFLIELGRGDAIASAIILTIFPPGSFLIAAIVYLIIHPANLRFMEYRLSKTRFGSASKLYEEALAAYDRVLLEAEREAQQEAERLKEIRLEAEQARESARLEAEKAERRKRIDHWMSLNGSEFERELGALFRRMGYFVESTAGSGDGGVDLILRGNGRTIVVQCKSHQAAVGPAIARELFGAMVASRADRAILACTGGFTRGVREFAKGKPISLISASELANLGADAEHRPLEKMIRQPICPNPGCGKEMIPRTGRHGRFWGCPRFPSCRGYRPFEDVE